MPFARPTSLRTKHFPAIRCNPIASKHLGRSPLRSHHNASYSCSSGLPPHGSHDATRPRKCSCLRRAVKKIRDPANLLAVTEGGPGRYVTPIDARRALRQPRRPILTILSQGHTVSQRLRKLKQMPAELYPLCTKRLTSSLLLRAGNSRFSNM